MVTTENQVSFSTDFIQITNGPSAGEIWDAGKYAYRPLTDFRVRFTGIRQQGRVTSEVVLVVRVKGLIHESGNGKSFTVIGEVEIISFSLPFTTLSDDTRFYYNANERSGRITISE